MKRVVLWLLLVIVLMTISVNIWAGGLALVLGIDSLDSSKSEQLVGNFLATGMLRGLIYVRGKVDSDSIGLKPPKEDIINYLSLYEL